MKFCIVKFSFTNTSILQLQLLQKLMIFREVNNKSCKNYHKFLNKICHKMSKSFNLVGIKKRQHISYDRLLLNNNIMGQKLNPGPIRIRSGSHWTTKLVQFELIDYLRIFKRNSSKIFSTFPKTLIR